MNPSPLAATVALIVLVRPAYDLKIWTTIVVRCTKGALVVKQCLLSRAAFYLFSTQAMLAVGASFRVFALLDRLY